MFHVMNATPVKKQQNTGQKNSYQYSVVDEILNGGV